MVNKFGLIITYFTSNKDAQPPPCFSVTLRLLENLPVDVYVIGGVAKYKDNYYNAKNVKFIDISLDEHVEKIRTLGIKHLNTDLIHDMKAMYRFHSINGWYCLHFGPMLYELYQDILSQYMYWGFMEIDILLNSSVSSYFHKTVDENYDVLNCGSWTGSFRVLKNDDVINTLWRNKEYNTDIQNFFKNAVEYEKKTGKNSHCYGAYNESTSDGGYINWLIKNKKILSIDNGVYCSNHFRAYGGFEKFTYEDGKLYGYKKETKTSINYWNADTYFKFNGAFFNNRLEEYAYTEDSFMLRKNKWELANKPRY